MEALAEIRGLTKVYGNTLAVNNLNLVIPRGRIIGLLGPNGSGKTTLIKMINGLLTPTAGQILINGFAPGPETKARIAYLPERTYLQSGMKVSDLVDFFRDFYADFNRDKAFTMLSALNIPFTAQLKTLSKGTKEKVQLILVMSRDADLFILDEPIAGVDPAARDYILTPALGAQRKPLAFSSDRTSSPGFWSKKICSRFSSWLASTVPPSNSHPT